MIMHNIRAKFSIDLDESKFAGFLQAFQSSLVANKSVLIEGLYRSQVKKIAILQCGKGLISVNIQMLIDESHMSDELAIGMIEDNLFSLTSVINKRDELSENRGRIRFLECSAELA